MYLNQLATHHHHTLRSCQCEVRLTLVGPHASSRHETRGWPRGEGGIGMAVLPVLHAASEDRQLVELLPFGDSHRHHYESNNAHRCSSAPSECAPAFVALREPAGISMVLCASPAVRQSAAGVKLSVQFHHRHASAFLLCTRCAGIIFLCRIQSCSGDGPCNGRPAAGSDE